MHADVNISSLFGKKQLWKEEKFEKFSGKPQMIWYIEIATKVLPVAQIKWKGNNTALRKSGRKLIEEYPNLVKSGPNKNIYYCLSTIVTAKKYDNFFTSYL